MRPVAFNPPPQLGKYAIHHTHLHERFDDWTKFPLTEAEWRELNDEAACQYDHDGMVTNGDCGGLEGWKIVECWGRVYAVYVTYTDTDGVFAWTACPASKVR